MKNSSTGLVHDSSELRKLIAENPDLPIVVLAGEEANNCGDYYWMYCSEVSASLDEILDTATPYNEEKVFTDRVEFKEAVSDHLINEETEKLSDAEFDALVEAEVAKYDPYWRKVIAIWATN